MMDEGWEMIPLESDLHKSDSVINQHIMQMIDTNIFWYRETFKAILMEFWKIRHGETTMNACETLNENETYESAMMCWESLDDSKPTSKKRKMLSQEEAMNDQANEIDDKPHTKRTANMGIGSLIPVNNLQLGANDNTSMLATQETLAKNLVYITNIPDGKMDRMKTTRDSSKNSGEQD